ncbi:hypothetical protein GMDG_08926, partial [Pseudogymnoascus destructans 20631-21]
MSSRIYGTIKPALPEGVKVLVIDPAIDLQVTTAATERDLLTNAELLAALGSPALSEAQLDSLNARLAAMIARHCRVPADGIIAPTLREETIEETFRLKSRNDCLILSRKPIVSVTSITEASTALVVADYEIQKSAGMLKRLSGDDYT